MPDHDPKLAAAMERARAGGAPPGSRPTSAEVAMAEQNPDQTPARLLREAESLFAKRGFEGVRTRDVASYPLPDRTLFAHVGWSDTGDRL